MQAVCVVAALASGCASRERPLLKATAAFSALASTSLDQVGDAPTIIHDLCVQRIQIEYVTRRLLPAPIPSFDEFVGHPLTPAGGAQTSWRELCAAYAPADAAFAKALAAIRGYAAQLGEITGKGFAPSVDFARLAAGAGDDATKLSGNAPRYRDAVAGIGVPLGRLADAIATRWTEDTLQPIIEGADTPLQDLVTHLDVFVTVVRTQQLAENRAAFAELRDALDALHAQKPELVSAVMIALVDVEFSDRFAKTEAKLKSLEDLLAQLGKAHAALRAGWARGDRTAVDTLRQLAGITKDAFSDVQKFQNPPSP